MALTFTADKALAETYAKLLALTDDEVFGRLLRRAAVEVLLDAYRRRFLEALPDVVTTERAGDRLHASAAKPHVKAATVERMRAAAEKLSNARERGDAVAAQHATTELRKARRAMTAALERPKPLGGQKLGPGNVYRPAVYKLMHLLSDAGGVVVRAGGVGIGPRSKVMGLKTPSATKHLDGVDTASDLTSLFRQVEFGTGIYGTDPEGNLGSPYAMGGGWFYGKSPNKGLGIHGAKPAHVLWEEAKYPYRDDTTRLEQFLARAIATHLTK
jgi:hypothetical protein